MQMHQRLENLEDEVVKQLGEQEEIADGIRLETASVMLHRKS